MRLPLLLRALLVLLPRLLKLLLLLLVRNARNRFVRVSE